jgi:hypothetical protein
MIKLKRSRNIFSRLQMFRLRLLLTGNIDSPFQRSALVAQHDRLNIMCLTFNIVDFLHSLIDLEVDILLSMKKPYSCLLKFLLFPLFSFLFPLAFALPYQEPVPGVYRCFAAGANPFDAAAQDTGATLEILADATYILKTASAAEQGFVTVQETAEFEGFFESGSAVDFVPNNSDAYYFGHFFVDSLGGMYVLVQLSDGNFLRCDSANTDIASTYENVFGSTTELPEVPVTPEDELLPATTKAPLPPAGAGGLSGFYMYEDKEGEYIPTFANNVAGGYFEFHNEYLYFMPDGYVYDGIYQWSYEALDCSRVVNLADLGLENAPLCDTYVVSNDTITYGSRNGPRSFFKDGSDLVIDGKRFVYQQPGDGLTFDGRFLFAAFDGYTLDEAYYTFSSDSTFKAESSSANNATASVADTTTYSSSYSETPVTFGAYAIRGNTIEFMYQDGRTVKKVFSFEKDEFGNVAYLYINGTIYSRE